MACIYTCHSSTAACGMKSNWIVNRFLLGGFGIVGGRLDSPVQEEVISI